MPNKKGFIGLVPAIIIAVIVLGGGFYLVQKLGWMSGNAGNGGSDIVQPVQQNQSADTAGWATYRDDKYGFEVKYPTSYSAAQVVPQMISFSAKENYMDNSSFSIFVADNGSNSPNDCLKDFNSFNSDNPAKFKEINGNKFYAIMERVGDSAMGGQRGLLSKYCIIRNNYSYIIDYALDWHEVGYAGVINTGKSSATADETATQKQVVQKHLKILDQMLSTFKFTDGARALSPALETYNNPEYGISFQYPAKYAVVKAPAGTEAIFLPTFSYSEPDNVGMHLPDSISIRWLKFSAGESPEQALINDVFYDGSGAHPKSFDEFALVHFGENDFYKISTGLFEGVLGYRYYLVKDGGAFDFILSANGVPWTDLSFNPENYPRKLELEEMLKTVKVSF